MLLLKPTLACNNNCIYCYERTFRHYWTKYDIDKMLEMAKKHFSRREDGVICLHGGEPLLLPIKDLERFLSFIKDMTGKPDITTNGILINDEHIKLFKKYKTIVAISIDGLEDANIRSSRETTRRIWRNIETLRSEGITVCLMVVVHKYNYNKLIDLIKYAYKECGVRFFKFNWMKYNPELELSNEMLLEVFKTLAKIHISNPELDIAPINHMLANLSGSDVVNDCYLTMCDVFCTERAKVILGDGTLTTCLQSQRNVMHFSRSETPSYERYLVLRKIPIQDGGCKGCKYWHICYGGCPSDAPDWRMKFSRCYFIYHLYEYLTELIKSVSQNIGIDYTPSDFNNFEKEKEERLEDKPIRRVIRKHPRFTTCGVKKTTVNGITQIEYPNYIEIRYKC